MRRAQADRLLYADMEKLVHFTRDPAEVKSLDSFLHARKAAVGTPVEVARTVYGRGSTFFVKTHF